MKYLDSHIHIDFYDNIDEVISRIISYDIRAIFVTHLPELYEKYIPKFSNVQNICLALGYHPILVSEYPFNRELFVKNFMTTKYIGEVGLDYFVTKSEKIQDLQRNVFEFICNQCKDHVLSVHSRQAEQDVLSILAKNRVRRAVFHWYTGSEKLVDDIINNGYYFSINPMMLKTAKGQRIIKRIPKSRILVESDGPFVKYKGSIIGPQDIADIYEGLSELLHESNLRSIVENNFCTLSS